MHLAIVHYFQRFVDIFDVVSVLVAKSDSESLLASLDALWRKLARQIPLVYVTVRSTVWLADIGANLPHCALKNRFTWTSKLQADWLTFYCHWHMHVDMKTWLVFRCIYILNFYGVPPALVVACIFFPLSAWSLQSGYLSLRSWPMLYYQFLAYRLPMSLLVFFFVRAVRRLGFNDPEPHSPMSRNHAEPEARNPKP